MDEALADGARRRFREVFGRHPTLASFAPGRVNLIGEHTDYNDGFVLPMALDRGIAAAVAGRDDRTVRAYTALEDRTASFSLDALRPGTPGGFAGYVAGVLWALADRGLAVPGFDVAIDSDLPIGAGLSSSAALQAAVLRAACGLLDIPWVVRDAALLCQRAENEYVGVRCGIMDPFASIGGRRDAALLLDCRSLESVEVPVPEDLSIVVIDTGVRRSLSFSAYNDRRSSCEAAVEALRQDAPAIRALRDVDRGFLEAHSGRLDETAYRRAAHVVSENDRTHAFAAALRAGAAGDAGRLMNESHQSLRDLYGVSGPELELATAIARSQPACFGARLTGAGFGGCAVALVRRDAADAFAAAVVSEYRTRSGRDGSAFVTRPAPGARLIE